MSRISHNAVLLDIKSYVAKHSPFIFENMWLIHLELEERIIQWWNFPIYKIKMFTVAKKLQNVKKQIKVWNKEVFGRVDEKKE